MQPVRHVLLLSSIFETRLLKQSHTMVDLAVLESRLHHQTDGRTRGFRRSGCYDMAINMPPLQAQASACRPQAAFVVNSAHKWDDGSPPARILLEVPSIPLVGWHSCQEEVCNLLSTAVTHMFSGDMHIGNTEPGSQQLSNPIGLRSLPQSQSHAPLSTRVAMESHDNHAMPCHSVQRRRDSPPRQM